MTSRRMLGIGLVLACLVGGSLVGPSRVLVARAAPVPNGVPSHFAIGLAAHPDSSGIYGWMPNSNIPWDYAFQYLSGGVNTGSGWETWNSSGQFPLYYAQGAASHNYIPVFSYYEMLQSNGTCGSCGEAQKDLSNMNNATLMASYFQNFTLLMQRLGSGTYGGIAGFSKTAIVHIEPDLSGYAQQAVLDNTKCYSLCGGQGNNPAYLKASVAGSGVSDVAAYPNTYQGFNWALLHLRDLYAPNVLLAFHFSNWATGQDISSNTSTSLDATSLGQQVGSFAAQSGITGVPAGTSSYNLLFNDVSDRDASYYKYVFNNPNTWWDRLNVSFPNFHRWESYVSAASQLAGRSVIVWQIPEGNQYFDTVNNTNGHYQDNRAEYFFSHIAELAQFGIIGLLFGAGNGGSTVHTDGMNDGITNPTSFCTSDGLSSGQICNNHTSSVSDDDGGYIRLQGQQYYASGGYSLGGTGTATPTNTPAPSPTMTATSVNTATPIVTPTNTATPTVTPIPTNTPTPIPLTVTFSGTSASPGSISTRHSEKLVGTVQFNGVASGVTIDYVVVNSAGSSVFSQSWTGQSFTANVGKSYTAYWKVPSNETVGTYTFQIRATNGGSTTYGTDNTAGTFTVM